MINNAFHIVLLELTKFRLVNIELLLERLNFIFKIKYLLTIILLLLKHVRFEHLNHLLMMLDNTSFRRLLLLT